MAISYTGMYGIIHLGADRISRSVRQELDDLPECDLNLQTCEALVPTGKGSQIYAHKLSGVTIAVTLAKTKPRRKRFGVYVQYHP